MTHPELATDLVARLEVLISEPIDAGVTPGVVLTVTNTGAFTAQGIVTTPRIEAPEGRYSWLNDAVLVGTLVPLLEDARPLGVSLEFHQIRVK
jgi:hypothetical protein